jgi:branched-chain amino acid aminotransferase
VLRQEGKVYLNGRFVLEKEAKISIFDVGFQKADSVCEAVRTFKHKPFKLKEHLVRLYSSMQYARINCNKSIDEMEDIHNEVLEANRHLLTSENDDLWMSTTVTRTPAIIIYCKSLSSIIKNIAGCYKTRAHAVTPFSVRNIPPVCMSPKLKTRSRMHFVLADLEVKKIDPEACSLLLDINGNITENTSRNFFIVSKGVLQTPKPDNILCGISRQTVLELADELNIPSAERNIQMYDAYNAEEAFFTTTSQCILPISQINGMNIGVNIPGRITNRLLNAWSEKVGVDIIKQAMSFL